MQPRPIDNDTMHATLNFRGLATFNQIQMRFIDIARDILCGHRLVSDDRPPLRITALELYVYAPTWEDPTTHAYRFGTGEQLKSGTWYLHRDGKLARKRLGLDITAGCTEPEPIHAGLLIAAIGDKDGSGNAVRTILRGETGNPDWHYDDEEMKHLKEQVHKSDVFSSAALRLEPYQGQKEDLLIGPRKLSRTVPEKFRTAFLRIATRTWPTSPNMEPLKR